MHADRESGAYSVQSYPDALATGCYCDVQVIIRLFQILQVLFESKTTWRNV